MYPGADSNRGSTSKTHTFGSPPEFRAKHLLLFLMVLAASACGPSSTHVVLATPSEAKAVVPIETETLNGGRVKVPRPGQVTVVDFWAVECEACGCVLPKVRRLELEFGNKGVAFLGVSVDDEPDAVAQELKRVGIAFPNVLDGVDDRVREYLGVDEVPSLLVFDAQGRLRYEASGRTAASRARRAIRQLLAGSAGKSEP